ncbi:hypothetical protein ACKWTF_002320 [Chironomus riparius]
MSFKFRQVERLLNDCPIMDFNWLCPPGNTLSSILHIELSRLIDSFRPAGFPGFGIGITFACFQTLGKWLSFRHELMMNFKYSKPFSGIFLMIMLLTSSSPGALGFFSFL